MSILTFTSTAEIDAYRHRAIGPGERIALVPTMGALHAGHLSLVAKAKEMAEHVFVSIFVNPIQFGPHEDFERYPRPLADDLKLLAEHQVTGVFLPEVKSMFPDGFQTFVDNTGVSQGLCGAERPGHFRGVCTVVLKLLLMTHADVAVFGKKDYQQLRVLERMVNDLNLRVQVVAGELLRDGDGLALSSRNRYLAPEARAQALSLPRGLAAAASLYEAGERRCELILEAARQPLLAAGIELAYLELRSQDRLVPLTGTMQEPGVLLAAVRVGGVRLIDNRELGSRHE